MKFSWPRKPEPGRAPPESCTTARSGTYNMGATTSRIYRPSNTPAPAPRQPSAPALSAPALSVPAPTAAR
ncbi:hypothetical protein PG991_014218 [Apiospora marii]|uniref:Uncharacterized protein n=1 Tax=Apiospora marii TaxID=335849 RepID=A0ABR1R942_9PEZI